MSTLPRQDSGEQQMRNAIHTATGLTLADRWTFDTLLWLADFGTGFLPDRFQPRSLIELAAKAFVSERKLKYSLDHLQQHGWLLRHRQTSDKGIGGRGRNTHYELRAGQDCDCKKPAHGEPDCLAKEAHGDPGKRLMAAIIPAGQGPVSAGRAGGRGKGEGKRTGEYKGGPVDFYTGWPLDSVGAEENNPKEGSAA